MLDDSALRKVLRYASGRLIPTTSRLVLGNADDESSRCKSWQVAEGANNLPKV